jgi:hypothetical protein
MNIATPPADCKSFSKPRDRQNDLSRANARWKPNEDDNLRILREKGLSLKVIAIILQRSTWSIGRRCSELGIPRGVPNDALNRAMYAAHKKPRRRTESAGQTA